MAVSQELHFIDPYLNPCKMDIRSVLKKMLQTLVESKKLKEVICWARASEVISEAGNPKKHSWEEVESELSNLLKEVEWPSDWKFNYFLIDEQKDKKMHGRYLLSIKGAIRLDQGFQQLGQNKTVDVSPVGKSIHDDLLRTYLNGKVAFTIFRSFQHG